MSDCEALGKTASAGAQSDLMNKERWGRRCMLQLQEAEYLNKPAATTWVAEFLLREGNDEDDVFYLFLQKQKIGDQLHIYL